MSTPHAGPLCLACLHQEYAEQVNRLVAEDREDLIAEVVTAYEEDALRAIISGEATEAPPPPRRG
jgi:hypothetical protein